MRRLSASFHQLRRVAKVLPTGPHVHVRARMIRMGGVHTQAIALVADPDDADEVWRKSHLVGGFNLPLWKIWKSIGMIVNLFHDFFMIFPIWKKKPCSKPPTNQWWSWWSLEEITRNGHVGWSLPLQGVSDFPQKSWERWKIQADFKATTSPNIPSSTCASQEIMRHCVSSLKIHTEQLRPCHLATAPRMSQSQMKRWIDKSTHTWTLLDLTLASNTLRPFWDP